MAYVYLGLKPIAPRPGTKQMALVAPGDLPPGAVDIATPFPSYVPAKITPTTGAIATPPADDLMAQLKANPLLLIVGGVLVALLISEVL